MICFSVSGVVAVLVVVVSLVFGCFFLFTSVSMPPVSTFASIVDNRGKVGKVFARGESVSVL